MKILVIVLLLGLAGFFGWKISEQQTSTPKVEAPAAPQITGPELPGLAPSLEGVLQTAQTRGAAGLRDFLGRYGKTIRDPRLAWIELDYVVLVGGEDPVEAKRVFARVQKRVTSVSPVYGRVKQLEKTYGR